MDWNVLDVVGHGATEKDKQQSPPSLSSESRRLGLASRSTGSCGRFNITRKKVKPALPTCTTFLRASGLRAADDVLRKGVEVRSSSVSPTWKIGLVSRERLRGGVFLGCRKCVFQEADATGMSRTSCATISVNANLRVRVLGISCRRDQRVGFLKIYFYIIGWSNIFSRVAQWTFCDSNWAIISDIDFEE